MSITWQSVIIAYFNTTKATKRAVTRKDNELATLTTNLCKLKMFKTVYYSFSQQPRLLAIIILMHSFGTRQIHVSIHFSCLQRQLGEEETFWRIT